MSTTFNKMLWLIAMVFSTVAMIAQPQDNSPYSRFGIGNLLGSNFSVTSSMGGLGATYQSYYDLNPANPASYSRLSYTAFDVGAYMKLAKLEGFGEKFGTQTGNLTYLALGFPVFNPLNRLTQKKDVGYEWGMSFGLVPFSQVAYSVLDTLDYGGEIGNVQNTFLGEGQLYKLYFGSAWDFKGLSAGINFNYIFGRNRYERTTYFQDLQASLFNNFKDEMNVSGFTTDIGIQYRLELQKGTEEEEEGRKNKTEVLFGATITPPIGIRTNSRKIEILANRISGDLYTDTLTNVQDIIQSVKMPLQFTGGVALEKELKWHVGINYEYGGWSSYQRPSAVTTQTPTDSLTNSWKVSVGGQFIPDHRSYNSFLKRVRYRVGGFYAKDPRVVQGYELNNYGITFGFGLPIRLARGVPSFVNLGFEFGRMGNENLIQENYFKTTVAFTLNDNLWFYKRKYK